MRHRAVAVLAFLAILAFGSSTQYAARAQGGPPKIVTASASAPKSVKPGKAFPLTITLTIGKTYHIQANPAKKDYIATVVSVGPLPGFTVGKVTYPKAAQANIAGDTLPVYEGVVRVTALVTPQASVKPGKTTLPITVSFQGCTDKTCYPPSRVTTNAIVTIGAGKSAPPRKKAALDGALILTQDTTPQAQTGAETSKVALSVSGFQGSKITQFMEPKDFVAWLREGGSQAGKADLVTDLLKRGGAGNMTIALGLIYLLGLALNLTPCVYPLIPITIGYFGRQAASGAKTGGLSVSYAVGMAIMYSLLGIFAALAGQAFGSWLNNRWVLLGFALLMFALGLSMFDRPDGRPIWELQLPASLRSGVKSRAGYAGAFLMGLMVGIVAAPCIGPIVVALIQVIGATRSVPLGFVTFFTLGIGLATPYLLLGFGLIRALPRAGEWMIAVKHIFGLLLFGMGIYYLRDLLTPAPYRIVISLYTVLAGVYLLLLDKAGASAAKFQIFKRVMGVAAVALGVFLFVPKGEATPPTPANAVVFRTISDYPALQAELAKAKADKKEVLIDFWATWCAACHELDDKTFKNPEVAKATGNVVALRVQLQEFDSDHGKPFAQAFGIVGLPTVVHLVPTNDAKSASL